MCSIPFASSAFFFNKSSLKSLRSFFVMDVAIFQTPFKTFEQRSQSAGCSLFFPTVSQKFQQRAHFWPRAFRTATDKVSPDPRPSDLSSTCDTRKSPASSALKSFKKSNSPDLERVNSTSASSELPISFFSRRSSSAFKTFSRIPNKRCHFSSSAALRFLEEAFGHSSRCTLSLNPRLCHTSSQVNESTGASIRPSAAKIS